MGTRIRWLAFAVLVVPVMLVGLVVVPRTLHAATLHVSTCAGDTSAGSLGGTIAAASSGDTILFDQDCATLTLSATLSIPANKNLTIDANQHTVALDGGNSLQILHLSALNNHGPTVTLTGLTFQHGKTAQGGAIFNDQGTLTIVATAIVNNTATDSGGGIENAGGTLKVTNSTFFGNKVTGTTQATGGAIDNNAFGTVTITNSTINGNSVSNSAAQSASGGGIFDFGTAANSLTITDTIVAGNEGGNCNGVDIGSANPNGVTSGGHNLIGVRHNNSGGPNCGVDFATLASASGEQIGTDATPINAKLGPLGNNGGHTPTLALLLGSPAIDAGGATCPTGVTTDQRGQPRPGGAGCDIGAFESNIAVQSIAVSNGGTATLKVGQTAQLKAIATYSDSETADVTTQVTWSSDNPAIASVNTTGVVTGQSAGNVTISAKIGTATGTQSVTVTAPTPIGIQIPPAPIGRPSGTTGEGTATPAPAPPPRTAPGGASPSGTGSGPAPAPVPAGR